ncbi:MAG: acetyl-CoA carboxylase carboxyl transferase subunit alpha [Bdellovibrionota bacterium]
MKNEKKTASAPKSPKLDASNPVSAWQAVEWSRHPARFYTQDYLDKAFSAWTEIKGDRSFREDKALIAGFGTLKPSKEFPKGQSVVFVGHQKGRKTKEKIERNFGMPNPEGYRKAQRAYALAERFEMPLLTFVDTPGAFPGIGAEERGQSEAIASSIYNLLSLKVPTLSVVIGEGGSGGALAMACTDKVLMFRNSTYSVISPESCAAILWSNAGKSKDAAVALKSAANYLKELNLCDEIIDVDFPEVEDNTERMADALHLAVSQNLKKLLKLKGEARMKKRFERYRYFDSKFLKGSK